MEHNEWKKETDFRVDLLLPLFEEQAYVFMPCPLEKFYANFTHSDWPKVYLFRTPKRK